MDSLAPERVVSLLRGRFGRPYRYLESCPSTQRELGAGDPEGAVVAAGHQTAGRGRLGRVWEDAPGANLLFSLLLTPPVPAERLPELTVVVAEAVAEAIGPGAQLKEPNDVLLRGRKVAGVLGEAREGMVVLGIGVNATRLLTTCRRPRCGSSAARRSTGPSCWPTSSRRSSGATTSGSATQELKPPVLPTDSLCLVFVATGK